MLDPTEKIIKILCNEAESKGYYHWIPLESNEKSIWLLRIPRWIALDPENVPEAWMKDEQVECIHICSPSNFVMALEMDKKELLGGFSGYMRHRRCGKCEAPMNEAIIKKINLNHLFK